MIIHDELASEENDDIRIIRAIYEPDEISYDEYGSQYMYCIECDGFRTMTEKEILSFLYNAISFVKGE